MEEFYMAYIDSINDTHTLGGANTIIECTTSASTATKIATTDMYFDPTDGLSFKIKFTQGSSVASTLNINDTGAKTITTSTTNDRLQSNKIYDCYYDGTNYVITDSSDRLEGKTWRETAFNGIYVTTDTSALTSSDLSSGKYTFDLTSSNPPYIQSNTINAGMVIRLTFRYPLQCNVASTGITGVNINYGGLGAKEIKYAKGGSLNSITSHKFNGGNYNASYAYKVWDAYTTLELMYTGSYWLVMGNPILCSYFSTSNNYTVYANGLIEQWGYLNPSTTSFTYLITYKTSVRNFICVGDNSNQAFTQSSYGYNITNNGFTCGNNNSTAIKSYYAKGY
jgi:hypothetical protein